MALEGNIAKTPLADVFSQITGNRATGTLTVEGPQGRKQVEIHEGALTVVVDGRGKFRLGDLLVARNKVTPIQLQDALKQQRSRNLLLGDMLCEMGLVTKGDIKKVLTFQLQEEVCELLTWQSGRFTFESGKQITHGSGSDQVGVMRSTQINVSPDEILVEVSKRAAIWSDIEGIIPSAHSAFRLTERGEKLLSSASASGRKLLELVRDSYDVAAMVRYTFVGRFHVSKALVDLIRAKAIEPILPKEMPAFAERMVRENKYEQAIGAYSWMFEADTDADRRREYAAQIRTAEEALEAITHVTYEESRGLGEEGEALAERAEAQRRKRSRSVLVRVVLLVTIIVAASAYIVRFDLFGVFQSDPSSGKAYAKVREKAKKLRAAGRLPDAFNLHDDFLVRYPNATDHEEAMKEMGVIRERMNFELKAARAEASALAGALQFDEAKERMKRQRELFSGSQSLVAEIDGVIRQIEADQAEHIRGEKKKDREAKLAEAEALKKEKRHDRARQAYREMFKPRFKLSSSEHADVQRRIQWIDDLEAGFKVKGREADALRAMGEHAKALVLYEQIRKGYPWGLGERAADQVRDMESVKLIAGGLIEEAKRLEETDPKQAGEKFSEVLEMKPNLKQRTRAQAGLNRVAQGEAAGIWERARVRFGEKKFNIVLELLGPVVQGDRFRPTAAYEPVSKLYEQARQAHGDQQFAQAERRLRMGELVKADRLFQKIVENALFKDLDIVAKAKDRRGRITAAEREIDRLLASAKRYKEAGDADAEWEDYQELAARFRLHPKVRDIPLELGIDSAPGTAVVWLNGVELGETPRVVRITPMQKGVLEIRKVGYKPGRVPITFPITRNHKLKLAKTFTHRIRMPGEIVATMCLDGDRLFVASGSALVAIRADTGELLWTTPLRKSANPVDGGNLSGRALVRSAPVHLKEYVYVAGRNGILYQILSRNGQIARRYNLMTTVNSGPIVYENPILRDVIAFVAGVDGTVHRINLEKDTATLSISGPAAVLKPMVRAGSLAVVADESGKIVAIDMDRSRKKWERATGHTFVHAPVVSGRYLAVSTEFGPIHLLDSETGELLAELPQPGGSRIALTEAGNLIRAEFGKVIGFNLSKKREMWRFTELKGAPTAGPAVHGRYLFVGTDKGQLVCLDLLQNGLKHWSLEVGERILGRPVASDTTVYFATQSGSVYRVLIE